MRTIGIVTGARSDFGIYIPILKCMEADPELEPVIIATGMHLSPEFGLTYKDIESEGFQIAERVEMLVSSDTPEGISKSVGLGILGFSGVFARSQPDILLLLGDRFEMFAAALAALPFKIPMAHIHGGEITEGAMDDSVRHSMTKMSHLHFVTTEEYARRVVQLGEEPWRVIICGAPGLDNMRGVELISREALERRVHLKLEPPPILVTFHPATLEFEEAVEQMRELLNALSQIEHPLVFTQSNADTGGRELVRMVRDYVSKHPGACIADNLGTQAYFSLMSIAGAMVGNSSSGIIEAPSFRLPVVNIGTRQKGRVRGKNVIDSGNERQEIVDAIRKAISPLFRKAIEDSENPYDRGGAAELIVERLRELPLNRDLVQKRFKDLTFLNKTGSGS